MPRPECTCGPGINKCPACTWWDREGRFLVAKQLKIRSGDIATEEPGKSPYVTERLTHFRGGPRTRCTQEDFEADLARWIQQQGRLPTMADFHANTGLRHSSRWVYRWYGSLPGFWARAVDQGWATERMRQERLRAMQRRNNRMKMLSWDGLVRKD